MHGYSVQSLRPELFDFVQCSYAPRNIRTQALPVTEQNIGRLAMELDSELYTDVDGLTRIVIPAIRFGQDQDHNEVRPLNVYVSDWLVALRGELHLFSDVTFRNTFAFGIPVPEPVEMPKDSVPLFVTENEFLVADASGEVETIVVRDTDDDRLKLQEFVQIQSDGRVGRVVTLSAADRNSYEVRMVTTGEKDWFEGRHLTRIDPEKLSAPLRVDQTVLLLDTGVLGTVQSQGANDDGYLVETNLNGKRKTNWYRREELIVHDV